MNQQDPIWRNQYAGGFKTDPDVEAALSGYEAPVSFKPATSLPTAPYMFGEFVKLR